MGSLTHLLIGRRTYKTTLAGDGGRAQLRLQRGVLIIHVPFPRFHAFVGNSCLFGCGFVNGFLWLLLRRRFRLRFLYLFGHFVISRMSLSLVQLFAPLLDELFPFKEVSYCKSLRVSSIQENLRVFFPSFSISIRLIHIIPR